jgi:hypothetical protein
MCFSAITLILWFVFDIDNIYLTKILKMQDIEKLLNIWRDPRIRWADGKTEALVSVSI